jgi:hypothetical protein
MKQTGSHNEFTCNNRGIVGNSLAFMWSVPRGYIAMTPAEESVVSQSVKRRLRGWCEMATSLGVSQLKQQFRCGIFAKQQ